MVQEAYRGSFWAVWAYTVPIRVLVGSISDPLESVADLQLISVNRVHLFPLSYHFFLCYVSIPPRSFRKLIWFPLLFLSSHPLYELHLAERE